MSTDASGIVFYGFPLPQLTVDYHDLNSEWAGEFWPPEPEDKANYRSPEWDDWRNRLREYMATPQHVEVTWSGGSECQQYFIHCPCYERRVYWDALKSITAEMLRAVDEEAERNMHKFCDKFNLPKRQAGWYLAALYF